MSNPRQVAFDALIKVEKQGGYSNLTLDYVLSKNELNSKDRAFVSNLFYGTVERKITLDYQLSLYLTKPLKKLKPEVLTIMRMGAYQILFMDKIPDSAAVNESVKLSKKNGSAFASSLINAVLRKVSSSGIVYPETDKTVEKLSVEYSCPQWLIEKWINEYGVDDTTEILKASIGKPPVYIRVNTTKTDTCSLKASFSENGINCECTQIDDSLILDCSGSDIERFPQYKEGLFHVQDLASQICAKALEAEEGDTVYDLCSAPGGKAYTVAETMKNKGKLLCFDIYDSRVKLISDGAKRLGLDIIQAKAGDASVFNAELEKADKVLCDVPCSGFGIIRRKPEIKYKDKNEADSLPEIQYSILANGAEYVKVGGRLLYSTCTLSKAENEGVTERFLNQNKDFEPAYFNFNNEKVHNLTLMPHKNKSDGFYICVFKRIK